MTPGSPTWPLLHVFFPKMSDMVRYSQGILGYCHHFTYFGGTDFDTVWKTKDNVNVVLASDRKAKQFRFG